MTNPAGCSGRRRRPSLLGGKEKQSGPWFALSRDPEGNGHGSLVPQRCSPTRSRCSLITEAEEGMDWRQTALNVLAETPAKLDIIYRLPNFQGCHLSWSSCCSPGAKAMALCGSWSQFMYEKFWFFPVRHKKLIFSALKNIQTRETLNSALCKSFGISFFPSLAALAGMVEIICSSYSSIYALYFETFCLKRSAKNQYYNNKQQFRNDHQSGKPR